MCLRRAASCSAMPARRGASSGDSTREMKQSKARRLRVDRNPIWRTRTRSVGTVSVSVQRGEERRIVSELRKRREEREGGSEQTDLRARRGSAGLCVPRRSARGQGANVQVSSIVSTSAHLEMCSSSDQRFPPSPSPEVELKKPIPPSVLVRPTPLPSPFPDRSSNNYNPLSLTPQYRLELDRLMYLP